MTLPLTDLYQTILERTLWTNNLIKGGFQTRISALEETITNVNLIEIALKHGDYICTRQFNRKEEGAESGADWLWCIGEPGAWISLLVQAKIVNPNTSNCHHLDYRSGVQRKLLVNFSRRHKFIPIYCIYSYIGDGYHPFAQLAPCLSAIRESEWACSFITPKTVRILSKLGQKKQKDLLRYGVPWTYPFMYAAEVSGKNLAWLFVEALRKAHLDLLELETGVKIGSDPESLVEEGKTPTGSSFRKRMNWEEPDPAQAVSAQIPPLVLTMLKMKQGSEKLPVAGVSLISTVPIDLNKEKNDKPPQLVDKSFVQEISSRDHSVDSLPIRARKG